MVVKIRRYSICMGKMRDPWKLRCPLKRTVHNILFIGTHPGLWQRDGGSQGAEVIQGKTELYGFGETSEGIATRVLC